MDRRTIPDHQHRARQTAHEMGQEDNDILPLVCSILHPYQQSASCCSATYYRQMVPRERDAELWRLTTWSIGSDHATQQIEPRFVYPHDDSAFGERRFLSMGQR